MNDYDYLAAVLAQPDIQHRRFAMHLQETWRQRELEYVRKYGRTAGCACLMYLPGDYQMAYCYADELQQQESAHVGTALGRSNSG
jgi:hypothetical protein